MNKLDMESKDIVNENIEKISKLFPNVIVESEKGKSIDFDLLKQELSKEIIEGNKEKYQLTWPGKKEAILNANTPCNKTLRPLKEKSVDFENTQNIYIEGDNLEVLKILQESYLNKIKCIYIDPPYNTGNDFIYNDKFEKDSNEELKESGQIDDYNNKLITNNESNGRFHSDWLSMMYSRLKLAKNLLTDDGVIFISIDDNEYDNLKKICDEIFGENNFISNIIRNTNSAKNQSLFISVSHDYCLVYSKNIEKLKIKHGECKWSVEKNNLKEYMTKVEQMKNEGLSNDEITEELKILTKYPRFIDFTNYWYFDEKGLYMKDNLGGVKNGNMQPLFNPLTNEYDDVPPGGFRYSVEKLNELKNNNEIHFHKDGSLPRLKRYLKDNMFQRPKAIMSDDQRPDYSLLDSFGIDFDNPKQLSFMQRIISIMDKDAIVLDFFSGSATTAHAIMQLNASDYGKRKYIMVQIPELCDKNSKSFKNGYETICDIGQERIRKSSEKIKKETKVDIDYGFRVYKIDSPNMKDVYYMPNEIKQSQLGIFESNIKKDRTSEDLLTQVILDLGLTLDLKIEEKQILNNKVYFVDKNSLVACFDDEININVVDEICRNTPLKVVFKDDSFKTDNDKINLQERFKKLSPNTEVNVL
ncbi:MAG: site-specific DNA-methyltransferase [Clostridia bacterium]|nr:site-specific DNA-methyltransferase [Clostridia bacterium]